MTLLSDAKRRASLRRREQGAVMFLVAMILAVLASVGVYALAAASSEVMASGNERQAAQNHYLSAFGAIGGAHLMSAASPEGPQLIQNMVHPPSGVPDKCKVSLPGVSSTSDVATQQACKLVTAGDLASAEGWATGSPPFIAYTAAPMSSSTPAGSLGQTQTVPTFNLEFTSPRQRAAPGYSGGMCFYEITMTSIGNTTPAAGTLGAGVEQGRGRIIAGPIQCIQ